MAGVAAREGQDLVEVLFTGLDPNVRESLEAVELLMPYTAGSPTTPTGAGMSQYFVEALVSIVPEALVSDYVLEILSTSDLEFSVLFGGTVGAGGVA